MKNDISLRAYHPSDAQAGDAHAFRLLNEAWIEKYFVLEEADRALLGDPEKQILSKGGQIYFAVDKGKSDGGVSDGVIGCCALIAVSPGVFQVAKMAVSEVRQGTGIGRMLLEYTIEQARLSGAERLLLETNRKLANAIHLYESLGFMHAIPDHPSPFARGNVFMELYLKEEHL